MAIMRVLIASLSNLRYLADYLAGRSHEVVLYQPRSVDLGDFRQTQQQPNPSLPYRLVRSAVWPHRPYPYSRFLSGFVPLLREFGPAALYLVGEPSELSVAQLARLCRRHSPKTAILDYSFENMDQQYHGLPRSLRGRAERETLPRLDMILAASTSARDRLVRAGYPAERIRVVPLGVPAEFYQRRDAADLRAAWGMSPEHFVVGFIGRLVPEKGVDLLLAALAQLPPRVRLAVVGDGPEEERLRSLAAQLNVADRVHWAGRQPRERIADCLSTLDTLVLPSRGVPVWQEQFGMVLVEAMLAGTPVVGSSSGAIPEVIGEAGLLFPENDATALAECLRRLVDDGALREGLSRRGLARARQEFTAEKYLGGIETALMDAVAQRS